jgi:hypothetical protein
MTYALTIAVSFIAGFILGAAWVARVINRKYPEAARAIVRQSRSK